MTSTLISTSSKTRSVTILTDDNIKDEFGNIEETKKAVERAINRARKNSQSFNNNNNNNTTSNLIGKDRRFAQALHQEADQLYQKGDYETALVLYHRAANICPRDVNHNAAVRRTATMINTWQNSSKRLRKFMSKTNPDSELTIALCPEVAAIKASNVLKQSPDFNTVNKVLNYFDEHQNLWKGSSSINTNITKLRLTRSNVILNRMKMMAETNLKKLEIAFHSGNVTTTVKYAKELLTMSNGIEETKRYETEAYRYLALTHVMLGRHDRAVNYVAKMIYIAKMSENLILMSQALVTLGKVHLSFDHLDAAAKAWEHLLKNLTKLSPILRAWINHEIGRCHLETGKFIKAFDMGTRTMEIAEDILSNKWLLHGKLLRAQALVKMARFSEALEEFKICARISEEEGDTPMLSYIQNLIVDLTSLLRKITFSTNTQIKLNKYVHDNLQDDSIMNNDTAISLCLSSQNLEEEEMNEQMNDNSTSRTFRKEFENSTNAEVRLTNSSNSTTSLKSQVTNATYVIDKTTCMQHQAEMGNKKKNKTKTKKTNNNQVNVKESLNECIFDNDDSQDEDEGVVGGGEEEEKKKVVMEVVGKESHHQRYLKEIDKIHSKVIEYDSNNDSNDEMLLKWKMVEEDEKKVEVKEEEEEKKEEEEEEEEKKEEEEEEEEKGAESSDKMIEIIRVALSMSKEELRSIEKIDVVEKPTTTTKTKTIDKTTDLEFWRRKKSREDSKRNDVGDSIIKGRMMRRTDFLTRSSFTKNNPC